MNLFFRYFTLGAAVSFFLLRDAQAAGDNNPTGVAGDFNGQVTTAGSYDPLTGNASREIVDIVVAGSVGSYPLKWVRRLNTRAVLPANPLGGYGGWSHSYQWDFQVNHPEPTPEPTVPPGGPPIPDAVLTYPDGRTAVLPEPWDENCCNAAAESPFGTWDRIVKDPEAGDGGNWKLLMADGGEVKFHAPKETDRIYQVTSIIDPYGRAITFIYQDGLLKKIKEPRGANARYLEIFYETKDSPVLTVIRRVEANDGFDHVTQWVNYSYERQTTTLTNPTEPFPYWYLTRADYSDGTHADYHYEDTNMPRRYLHDPTAVFYRLVSKCEDVRFDGPMKTIQYDYLSRQEGGNGTGWGQIHGEKNGANQLLSWVESYDPPGGGNEDSWRKEHRRGPHPNAPDSTREFRYHYYAFVKRITDFYEHPSEASIYFPPGGGGVSEVHFTDARQKTTIKTREPRFGATIRVTYPAPDGSAPPYTETQYWDTDRPHYVHYQWDERQKLTEYLRYPANDPNAGNAVQRINHPDNTYETFVYNGLGQVTDHKMRKGGTEKFGYDSRGLKQTYTPPATESDDPPHSTQYIYFGTQGGPGNGPDQPWRPDLIDRLARVIDPRGFSTYYYYNPRGQVTHINHHDGTSVENHYYDDGTLDWTEDELHHRTTYHYDDYKRVTGIENHLHEIITHYYAPENGNSLLHTTSSIYRVQSHLGKKTDHDYDLNFRRIWTKQAPGLADEATTNFHYDAVGNMDRMEDPRHNFTTFEYDERNRQTLILNEGLTERTEFRNDPAGNKIREKRPDNYVRSWDYDEMNRLEFAYDWRLNPDDPPQPYQTTTYFRDDGVNVTAIKDTKGVVYEFEYDDLNRKTKAKYPTSAPSPTPTETWRYDYAGNILEYKNPAGQIRHFHHDHRNRQDDSWWTGSGALGSRITTVYDWASRVSSITTNNGQTVVAFGYDDANRKLWEEQTLAASPGQPAAISHRVNAVLDQDGMRTSLQIIDPPAQGGGLIVSEEMSGSGSYSVTYDYTGRNQLWHIYGGMGEDWTFTYDYDLGGNMISRQANYKGNINSTNCPNVDPNGAYDALNRPKKWEQVAPNGFYALSEHKYDHANREVSVWRQPEGRGDRFEYEPTNQLSGVGYNANNVSQWPPGGAERTVVYGYSPDKLNRDSVTTTIPGQGTTVKNYVPNGINQYMAVGGTSFSYDNNFNLTGTGALFATYNSANQLVGASNATETPEATFVYDGLGRCVKRTIGGEATVFVFDGWKPIGELDAWNNFQAWNVYGPGADEILLRQKDGVGYTFFLLDRHGNVAFLVDNDGHLLETYTYDVFGRPTMNNKEGQVIPSSWYTHNFLFQGREYISQLGVYDYRNRFYHPDTGRFLQPDPTGFDAGDMNLFRYCSDDPIDRTDPTGLEIDYHGDQENWNVSNQYLSRSPLARGIIADANRLNIPIYENSRNNTSIPTHGPKRVNWDPHSGLETKPGNRLQSPAIGVIHELDHAVRKATDPKGFLKARGTKDPQYGNQEDRRSVERERIIIQELNSGEGERFNHGGGFTRTNGPTSRMPTRGSFGGESYGTGSNGAETARSSPGSESSRPTAAQVDALHQATGVPSLGAEAVNSARGSP